VIRQINC